VNGTVLNIATGRPVTVLELAEAIGSLLGRPAEPEFLPERAGDVRDSWADVSAARRLLGYEPAVDLRSGLERTADAILGRIPDVR
jgi:UDP-glucose 4-epimerase